MKLIGRILLALSVLIIIGITIYLNIIYPNPQAVLMFSLISAFIGFVLIVKDNC